jgi:hypothetical protein
VFIVSDAIYIRFDLDNLLLGDFCAGSLLIAFGVVLGKVCACVCVLSGM